MIVHIKLLSLLWLNIFGAFPDVAMYKQILWFFAKQPLKPGFQMSFLHAVFVTSLDAFWMTANGTKLSNKTPFEK